MGLYDNYATIREQILLMNAQSYVRNAYLLLTQEKKKICECRDNGHAKHLNKGSSSHPKRPFKVV